MQQWTELVPKLMSMKSDCDHNHSEKENEHQKNAYGDEEPSAALNERGEDYQEQIGMPDEENMRSWSHHHSTDTVDDPVFRAAMRGYDTVSFVFGLEVTWSLIQQRQQEDEERQAMLELENMQEMQEALEENETVKDEEDEEDAPGEGSQDEGDDEDAPGEGKQDHGGTPEESPADSSGEEVTEGEVTAESTDIGTESEPLDNEPEVESASPVPEELEASATIATAEENAGTDDLEMAEQPSESADTETTAAPEEKPPTPGSSERECKVNSAAGCMLFSLFYFGI